MPTRPGVMLAAVLMLSTPVVAQRPAVIDGKTIPGMTEMTGAALPAYLVWRSAFRMLRNVNSDPEHPSFPYIAGVSPEQQDLILETAIRSAEAEIASWEHQKKVLAEWQARGGDAGRDQAQLRRTLWEIDYSQRVTTLQERDALLLQLASEARASFEAWVEELRTGTKSFVPDADLELYRLPS